MPPTTRQPSTMSTRALTRPPSASAGSATAMPSTGDEQGDQPEGVGDDVTGALRQPVTDEDPDGRSDEHGAHVDERADTGEHSGPPAGGLPAGHLITTDVWGVGSTGLGEADNSARPVTWAGHGRTVSRVPVIVRRCRRARTLRRSASCGNPAARSAADERRSRDEPPSRRLVRPRTTRWSGCVVSAARGRQASARPAPREPRAPDPGRAVLTSTT